MSAAVSSAELPTPRTERGRAALEQAVRDPGGVLVAVDFDGTLAPIVDEPDAARAHPDAADVLTRVAEHVAGLAIVTGRPASDTVRFGELLDVPGLVVVGHYGLEWWADGALHSPTGEGDIAPARAALESVIADADLPGVHLEDKGLSVAVHTRRATDPAGALETLWAPVHDLAAQHGLEVVPGRNVLELRPPGTDKGGVLTGLVRAYGARTVIYAGDDLGDLPAMRMVHTDPDIAGLVVVSHSEGIAAEVLEMADLEVDGPDGVLGLLEQLLQRWAQA